MNALMKKSWHTFLCLLLCAVIFHPPHQALAESGTYSNRMYNMSYLFFGGLNTYVSQVDRTKGSLDSVSPNYFDIKEDGELDITWKLQTSFITEMHKRGIKVTPFLANHWDKTAGINGLNNREKLARDIAAAIEKYNLDGIDVDIEGVGHAYRDAHTNFIRLLRQYIPAHKEVSVAVAANPNGWTTGWHGFYDYKGLAQYADYLMIMAYDESWESPESPVGPVSSLPFFERSIQYAIKQNVPKDRIVIGLPFYARIWKLDGPTLENRLITGKGMSGSSVAPLVSRYNGSTQFDEKSQTPFATFTIPRGEQYFLGSTKLTEGKYQIWYEDERSIRAKLKLPGQYGIKGTGSWALAHETEETWNYYSSALNAHTVVTFPTQFESGVIGVAKADSTFIRETGSSSSKTVKVVPKGAAMKVIGSAMTGENQNWYPVQLPEGTVGYVADSELKSVQLKELYGQTRYETGVVVSHTGWSDGAKVVILGRGDLPIDALTGSVLAKKYGAPLLLTTSSTLSEQVATELSRLNPKTIYLLGGEGAISNSVEGQLMAKGYEVKRIAGTSRYDTSVKVASEVGVGTELFLTTGKESPDALSIAPYAGIKQIPIIFTEPTRIPAEVKELIQAHKIEKVTVIGGDAAVSEQALLELKALGVTTIERIAGANRFETSVAIAKRFRNEFDLKKLYFASGYSFIDALPGSPLAAMNNSPILLTNNTSDLPVVLRDFLQNELSETPNVTILGGYGVIPVQTRGAIFQTVK